MVPLDDPAAVPAEIRAFLQEERLALRTLVFDEDDEEGINTRFELPGGLPYTLAIDASGQIVDRQAGAAGEERFDEMMRKALGL